MSFEQVEHNETLSPQPAPDEELQMVAEYLNENGYEDLGDLLESLAVEENADQDAVILKDIDRLFKKHMALMPEHEELLSNALAMINLELSASTSSQFSSREQYLRDLESNPQKYVQRSGDQLIITQPGNSVKHTRIHDFIGADSKIIAMPSPDHYQLVHNGANYTWSETNRTWENVSGERLKLRKPTETVKLEQIKSIIPQKDIYNYLWNKIQPQKGPDGTLRGGLVQVRNHLFMDYRERAEAKHGKRPDPVPRAFYYYGQNIRMKPEALAYTGYETGRHKTLQKIFRSGFVRAAPTAGGGIATMEEASLAVFRDYAFLGKEARGSFLDENYEDSLAMANEYLDLYSNANPELMGEVLRTRSIFDARVSTYMTRLDDMENSDTGLAPSMVSELYVTHAEKLLNECYPYMKSLNKLPKRFRDKYVRNKVLPKLKKVLETIPDDYSESQRKIGLFINQVTRSLGSNSEQFRLEDS